MAVAPFTVSPDRTAVVSPATTAITDTAGNKWTISFGRVAVNGTRDMTTSGVTKLAWVNKVIWHKNSTFWYGKSSPGAVWLPTNGTTIDPLVGVVTPPPPPPPPPPKPTLAAILKQVDGLTADILALKNDIQTTYGV